MKFIHMREEIFVLDFFEKYPRLTKFHQRNCCFLFIRKYFCMILRFSRFFRMDASKPSDDDNKTKEKKRENINK